MSFIFQAVMQFIKHNCFPAIQEISAEAYEQRTSLKRQAFLEEQLYTPGMEFFFKQFALPLQKLFMVYSVSPPHTHVKEYQNTHLTYDGWRQFVKDLGFNIDRSVCPPLFGCVACLVCGLHFAPSNSN